MRPLVAIPVVGLALTLGVAAPLVGDPLAHHTRQASSAPGATAAAHHRSFVHRAVAEGTSAPALVIPSLGVNAPVLPTGAVGAPGSASLTVPKDIDTVGWWDGVVTNGSSMVKVAAPAPGDPGVAIIAGHVDSAAAGAGALFNLRSLDMGDAIRVVNLDRRTTTWRVYSAP
jgi:Sortase domain